LKYGTGEGWRRSVGPIVWKTKKNNVESSRTGISYIKKGRKDNWIGHVLLRNCLMKHSTAGKIQERIDVLGR